MSTPVQELPSRYRLTVEEYQRMGQTGVLAPDLSLELIEGDVVQMPPIGSWHAGVVKRLNKRLEVAVGDKAIVSVQDPVVLGDHSQPQPDLALLRYRKDFYTSAHPRAHEVLVVVEVAESTLAYDRDVKLPLYARFGIPELWLVDVPGRCLGVYRNPRDTAYRDHQPLSSPDRLAPLMLPDCWVDLRGLLD